MNYSEPMMLSIKTDDEYKGIYLDDTRIHHVAHYRVENFDDKHEILTLEMLVSAPDISKKEFGKSIVEVYEDEVRAFKHTAVVMKTMTILSLAVALWALILNLLRIFLL